MSPLNHLVGNFITLSIILTTFHNTGSDPRVIVYTFILLALVRFLTVEGLMVLYQWFKPLRPFLSRLCSPPAIRQKPILVNEGNKPAGAFGYYIFVIFPGFLAVALVNKYNQGLTPEMIQMEITWTLAYTALYWAQDIFGRATIVDFQKEQTVNLAYNMVNVMILFFALMIGGFVFTISENYHLGVQSPWLICGPLLVIKHLYDFNHWRKNIRVRKA